VDWQTCLIVLLTTTLTCLVIEKWRGQQASATGAEPTAAAPSTGNPLHDFILECYPNAKWVGGV